VRRRGGREREVRVRRAHGPDDSTRPSNPSTYGRSIAPRSTSSAPFENYVSVDDKARRAATRRAAASRREAQTAPRRSNLYPDTVRPIYRPRGRACDSTTVNPFVTDPANYFHLRRGHRLPVDLDSFSRRAAAAATGRGADHRDCGDAAVAGGRCQRGSSGLCRVVAARKQRDAYEKRRKTAKKWSSEYSKDRGERSKEKSSSSPPSNMR